MGRVLVMPDKKNFITTKIDKHRNYADFDTEAVSYVKSKLDQFQIAREEREDIWLECWAMYFGNPRAMEEIRKRVYHSVGDVSNNWRHRITTGKAFENVETVLAHMMAAFFPNRDWFEAVPVSPGYQDLAKLIKKYTATKLQQGHFITHWQEFLRQLLITGQSVIALPWRQETAKYKKRVKVNKPQLNIDGTFDYDEEIKFKEVSEDKIIQNCPDFETLDMFDCFLDPTAISAEQSDFIRRVVKSKAEMVNLVKGGYYTGIKPYDVVSLKPYYGSDYSMGERYILKTFEGIEVEAGYSWSDQVEVWEFWGDITVGNYTYKDVVATVINDQLVRFENNPYWAGKPFIFGTYIPINRSTSSMGVLEPTLGLLHEMNILTNQRLDNLELSVNSMWEHVDDGTLAPEDIYSEPGKVFSVTQQGTIVPISMPNQFVITYDEQSVLEQRIDKNTGTGVGISANASRNAERVTAAEIRAVREAGGSRLSTIHKHIEETALIPCLNKVFRLFQQFVTNEEIVRVAGKNPGDFDFFAIGTEDLQNDFLLTPVGADHVADKEFEINQRLQFLQIASQQPEMSQHINYYNFMLDLARRMGIDDIDQFIVEQNPNALPQGEEGIPQPQDPTSSIQGELGKPTADAIRNNFMADGGANMIQTATGQQAQVTPEMLQQFAQ